MSEPEITTGSENCLNCGAPLSSNKFCGICGQKKVRKKLDILQILGDAWVTFTDLDNRFYRTVIHLLIRPGDMISDYVAGKRVHYFGPVQYYLILFVLVVALGLPGFNFSEIIPEGEQQIEGMPIRSQFWIGVVEFVESYIAIYFLLLSPIFALIVRILFHHKERSYTESLVFVLYLLAQYSLVIALTQQIDESMLVRSSNYNTIKFLIFSGPVFLYIAWAASRFYGESLVKSYIASTVIIAITWFLVVGVYNFIFALTITDEVYIASNLSGYCEAVA